MNGEKKTCCFFGHRKIAKAESLKTKVYEIMEDLILNKCVDTFLMGSRSEFDSLCREILSELKEKYPHIKRIYVRGEYPEINESYEEYLLKNCEQTYFPKRAENAGKAVYIQRNYEMIDKSQYCIVYYNENYTPPKRKKNLFDCQPKSGTKLACDYAVKKKKTVINAQNE